MVWMPGEFGSFGQDYRADMVRFVQDTYRFRPTSEEQVSRIERALRSLDLDRAQRIEATHQHAAPPSPARRTPDQDAPDGVPLRTRGAPWLRGQRQAPA